MTKLETTVYNTIMSHCEQDYSSSVPEIATNTGLSFPTIKGAVGSLVKKGKVAAESETRDNIMFKDLFPMDEYGNTFSFGEWN